MNKIHQFLETPHSTEEYKEFVKELCYFGSIPTELDQFFVDPASTKYHGCNPNGLIIHSLRVYACALDLAPAFGFTEDHIDARACILHDLCKMGMYVPNTYSGGAPYMWNPNADPALHGYESVVRLYKLGIEISSKAWELAIEFHMGAFEEYNSQNYSKACQKYPEVLLLHTADMMASTKYHN